MKLKHALMMSTLVFGLVSYPVLAAPEGGSGTNAEARPDLDSRNTGPGGQGSGCTNCVGTIVPGSMKPHRTTSPNLKSGNHSCGGCGKNPGNSRGLGERQS